MNQVQHLRIVQPLLAQCIDVPGVERGRFERQVDGELHDGFFTRGRTCRMGGGKYLGDNIIALGQLFEALRVH